MVFAASSVPRFLAVATYLGVLCAMNFPVAALAGNAVDAIKVSRKAVMGRVEHLLLEPTLGRVVSIGVFLFYLRF
jgi:hypothetical protein